MVFDSQGLEASLYEIMTQNNMVSLIARNSVFTQTYLRGFKIEKAHFYA